MRADGLVAHGQRVPEHGLLRVQLLAHAAPLRALTGEDEDRAGPPTRASTSGRKPGVGEAPSVGGERLRHRRGRVADHGQPMIVVAAAHAGGVAELGQRRPTVQGQLVAGRQCVQRLGRPGGQRQQLDTQRCGVVRRRGRPRLGGLGQHDVRVRATEAERADPGECPAAVLGPRGQVLRDTQRQTRRTGCSGWAR